MEEKAKENNSMDNLVMDVNVTEKDGKGGVMAKYMLHFVVTKKTLNIALSQITGQGIMPLTPYYSWPLTDAWEDMERFLETQKWVSKEDSFFLLNSFTQVINYWNDADREVLKDIRNVKEIFPESNYPNFHFLSSTNPTPLRA